MENEKVPAVMGAVLCSAFLTAAVSALPVVCAQARAKRACWGYHFTLEETEEGGIWTFTLGGSDPIAYRACDGGNARARSYAERCGTAITALYEQFDAAAAGGAEVQAFLHAPETLRAAGRDDLMNARYADASPGVRKQWLHIMAACGEARQAHYHLARFQHLTNPIL